MSAKTMNAVLKMKQLKIKHCNLDFNKNYEKEFDEELNK